MTSELHLADTNRFKIRPATKGDLQTLTDDIWFNSFGLSSYWAYLFPDSTICRRPDIPGGLFDMELIEAFFGGVEVNRKEVMGERSHWFLEILGVHEDYQGKGVGASQLKWGTDQADEDSLETYLDGSTAGQPYYEKRHGFVPVKKMPIPDREPRGALSMPR
ncbi:unnamed protein product [Zymoseptoria tritici ST99CH_3D7]|uniref:N-acetyltransferase domain-containing protein n=1 Tax=Zymoseptoria tritici (strain ST99CH_3D7) TaxID=1276538 RepID=A0A1X7RIE1_ZYMT9|nr:unnamed protein product [Zymoseptoria tritici ST99CH_3D7]